jgi:dihydrofolate synthase/folylpolyglutamate synthase
LDVFRGAQPWLKHLKSPLTGTYQRKNILTVAWTCEQLNRRGIKITIPTVRRGILKVIENTGLAGRWQILSRNPLTICDTGHNEGGLREVLAQIEATPHNRLHFVFGVVNDKHLPPIFELLPRNATYYFCKPDIPRGLDAKELQQAANKVNLAGSYYTSVKAALNAAQRAATAKDLVFVGGSTFVVAEVV